MNDPVNRIDPSGLASILAGACGDGRTCTPLPLPDPTIFGPGPGGSPELFGSHGPGSYQDLIHPFPAATAISPAALPAPPDPTPSLADQPGARGVVSQGQPSPGEQLWADEGARAGIKDALSESVRAVLYADSYRKNREQGAFVYENPDGTFSHTKPNQYAPHGEHYTEGTAFGPALPIPPPEGTRAIAFAFPRFWYHDTIEGGYGAELSRRSKSLGLPLFGVTTGRDAGSVYLFEPGGWRQLK